MKAAVENGADAVYLGGKSFGARAYAENFTRQELGEALAYAHLRGVRVYVTVNTLVDNEEFGELSEFLLFLYREGVDALLVQDIGVVEWVRQVLPSFPLHGSTQMTIHNAAGVQFLADLGLRRVVLARETSYQELLAIRQQSGLELEMFVHGALCISYSGQCLFSSLVGGRSGNRGNCAGPCRMAYTLVDSSGHDLCDACPGQHLLSTRDLMLMGKLPQLVRAGVACLKIEGRMKRPEYVATVVRIYRHALDRACQDPDGYRVSESDVRDLAQVFNRGFTTGYFDGRPGRALISYTRPNNRGLYLGRVLKTTPGKGIVFKTRLPLRIGDGIEFWMQKGDRGGITVHNMLLHLPAAATGTLDRALQIAPVQTGCPPVCTVDVAEPGSEVEVAAPFAAMPGDRVFKTHDERLISEARLSFTGPGRRKVPIRVIVRGRRGEALEMEAVDADGIRAAVRGTFPGEVALKHPLTPEVTRVQLERLGNTPFDLAGLDCDLDGSAMYPLSELNAVRRALTAALESARLDRFRRAIPDRFEEAAAELWSSLRHNAALSSRPPSGNPLLAVAVADYASLDAAVAGGASIVYFGGLSYRGRLAWNPDSAARAVELCRSNNVKACLILPRIWKDTERSGVDEWLATAMKLRFDGVMAGDLGGLSLVIQSGLAPVTDFSIPVFNDLAVKLLLRLGAARLTLSPELNRGQLQGLCFRGSPCLEMVVHGTLPMMVSEHCPVGCASGPLAPGSGEECPGLCQGTPSFLDDRQGYRFPLQLDEHCRMTLYNARELCLIEHLGDIIQDGYGSLRLDLRSREAKAVREITGIYKRALEAMPAGRWSSGTARQAWEQLDRLSVQGLTRGHYLRGVIEKREVGC